jgi:hypothetical protein
MFQVYHIFLATCSWQTPHLFRAFAVVQIDIDLFMPIIVNDYRKPDAQMALERELRGKPIWLEIERPPLPACLKFRKSCSADAGKRVPNQHIQHPQPADVGSQEDHSGGVRLNRAYNHSLVPERMSTHGCERRFCHLWGNDSQ